MKTVVTLAALALISAGAARAQDQVRYVAAMDIGGLIPTGALSASVPTGPGAMVLVAHRDKTGDVEVHTRVNDELVVRAGRGSILIGPRSRGLRKLRRTSYEAAQLSAAKAIRSLPAT